MIKISDKPSKGAFYKMPGQHSSKVSRSFNTVEVEEAVRTKSSPRRHDNKGDVRSWVVFWAMKGH